MDHLSGAKAPEPSRLDLAACGFAAWIPGKGFALCSPLVGPDRRVAAQTHDRSIGLNRQRAAKSKNPRGPSGRLAMGPDSVHCDAIYLSV